MPPWPPRSQSHTSNTTIPYAPTGNVDVNRPLPPVPPTVDLDVPTLNPRRRADLDSASPKHGRSFSHPFPSFFGGGSKRSEKRNHLKNKLNIDSTDDDDSVGDGRSSHSSNVPSRNPSLNANSEPMTGRCMACDSTVRWPRDLKVFRCTICLTINDLEPNQGLQHPPGPSQNNTPTLFGVPRKRRYSPKVQLS
jgi:E3 ubiquitin-protein ligase HECTD2